MLMSHLSRLVGALVAGALVLELPVVQLQASLQPQLERRLGPPVLWQLDRQLLGALHDHLQWTYLKGDDRSKHDNVSPR